MFHARTTRPAPSRPREGRAGPGRSGVARVPPSYGIGVVDQHAGSRALEVRKSCCGPATAQPCASCGQAAEAVKNPDGRYNDRAERKASRAMEDPSEEEALKNTASTAGARIDITFNPSTSSLVTNCKEIVHTQFVRQWADGKSIKPGTYFTGFNYQDAVTTGKNWGVDFVRPETTPDYQQGTGVGKKNGGTTNATMNDTPGTAGGDRGFRSPGNTTGWNKVVYSFATYAWCKKGKDCGKWYEGLTWKYVKTAADAAANRPGTASVEALDVEGPLAPHLEAFDKFNKHFGYKPCKS